LVASDHPTRQRNPENPSRHGAEHETASGLLNPAQLVPLSGQITTVGKQRLIRLIGTLSEDDVDPVARMVCGQLGL
jgi:hypothetical protein